MRAPAGSFCKAGVRFFARARQAVFVKQGRTIFARARRVALQSSGAFFVPGGPPLFPVCPPSARVHPPPAAARTPFPLSTPAHARFPLVMAPFPRPLHAPLHARPLSSSSCPVRTRPLSLPFSPFPPPGPAIIRSSIPGARPLSHSVRPAAAPVSPCAAAPFPSLFTIPRASFAKKRCPRRRSDTAGVRPRLPCLRRSLLRSAARERGGWRRNGRCRHKAGLPRGRGAGIRRNGRQNRQAGLPRAVGGGGTAPASVPASFDFAARRAREGTRMAAQRSLPGIKPACRAGGARVSAGMVGKIVRPACRARERGGGAAQAFALASFDFAACRAREGTRVAAQRSLPGIKPACRARWAAGVRPRLPCLRRSILRPAARGKGRGWRRNGRCRHKAGLPRGRGAGIRRNGRQNRQAGLPRAVGGGGTAPASVPASFDFAARRAREGTRMAAQRSLPGIKPACRAGGARVSAGMVGKIVRPAR